MVLIFAWKGSGWLLGIWHWVSLRSHLDHTQNGMVICREAVSKRIYLYWISWNGRNWLLEFFSIIHHSHRGRNPIDPLGVWLLNIWIRAAWKMCIEKSLEVVMHPFALNGNIRFCCNKHIFPDFCISSTCKKHQSWANKVSCKDIVLSGLLES